MPASRPFIFFACLGGLLIGLLTYAYFQQWIIIQWPQSQTEQHTQSSITKKKVTLFFWHKQKWKTETEELLWSDDAAINVEYLVNAWLSVLEQEGITQHKITVQSACTSPSGSELYLSLDSNPLQKDDTTFNQWMLIEGLLKTMRENGIKIPHIRLLVHHQLLQHPTLDFTAPWPLHGFASV